MFNHEHGGQCCGIKHIHDMGMSPTYPDTWNRNRGTKLENLKRIIGYYDEVVTNQDDVDEYDEAPVYNDHRVKEVVLADYQLNEGWEEALIEVGFKKVASFENSNSGNVCHVFYHHPALTLYGNAEQPARMRVQEVEVPGPPAREERREILVEYFPNFRASGRGRPFSSVEEVRGQHPLVRRIDRRTVFNDGTIEWQDDI